jgi:two-component system response regulator YesN
MLREKFQISPKYLSQLFKDSIGQNFSDFLIGLRIEHAKKILRETDDTVQDISKRSVTLIPPPSSGYSREL